MATPTQNILENIISSKIVTSGGGYVAKLDIVNVDMVQHSATQCGQVGLVNGTYTILDSNITAKSVILLTPTYNPDTVPFSYYVSNNPGIGFTIQSPYINDNTYINYFIARY